MGNADIIVVRVGHLYFLEVKRPGSYQSPEQKQFDLAVAILEAYRVATDEEGRGAVMFNGEMIDEASRKMALQVEAAGRAAGMTPTPVDA